MPLNGMHANVMRLLVLAGALALGSACATQAPLAQLADGQRQVIESQIPTSAVRKEPRLPTGQNQPSLVREAQPSDVSQSQAPAIPDQLHPQANKPQPSESADTQQSEGVQSQTSERPKPDAPVAAIVNHEDAKPIEPSSPVVAHVSITPSPTAAPSAGQTVHVVAEEWHLTPDISSVLPGKVTFQLVNKGQLMHQLVVLRTDLAVPALPATAENHILVDEAKAGVVIGRTENTATDEVKTFTVDLPPGHYVLLCNLPAHVKAGMVTEFSVQAAK